MQQKWGFFAVREERGVSVWPLRDGWKKEQGRGLALAFLGSTHYNKTKREKDQQMRQKQGGKGRIFYAAWSPAYPRCSSGPGVRRVRGAGGAVFVGL
jgi:hypothetical protein